MNDQLQQTLTALQGDLTSLDPAYAAQLVSNWQQTLQNANFDGAQDLQSDLADLASRLRSGDLGGVGALLSRLGAETSDAAGNASGSDAQGLNQLGAALSDAGSNLG